MPKILIDTDELYVPQRAIELLDIGYATFWRWIKKGKLVALKLNGRTFIPKSEIERLTKERASGMSANAQQ